MNRSESITVRMPGWISWLLRIGAGTIGVLLGFLVKPLVGWVVAIVGDAPGPLRLAASLPTGWAVPVLALVGLLAGIWLAHTARHEALLLTVSATAVHLRQKGMERRIPREAVSVAFLDGKELVLLASDTTQLARYGASDLPARQIRDAFDNFQYAWFDHGDPHEHEFQSWVDGHPMLDETRNRLLRSRSRALSENRWGTAADLADDLQEIGLVVRDRGTDQEYRTIARSGKPRSEGASDSGSAATTNT
ncbi:hypothetical protein GIY23_21445 [Allosaccharopolyspora coralli]|uniref:Uncharacterized protein n=1 Tax=Allosaccharopolyspora coralli TaxID=2665642 RepID=A0A5Q3QED6_9PSEU|nr:hypothetical protein [Allosaccharopolyspora coralli]QGK71736.1 hypothetical protein GIY23_21445 [Allosaccharopolyspora coralli]